MNYRKISAKIFLFLIILLPFFAALPANAAALNVTLKSDFMQINGGGTANLTVKVTDTASPPNPIVGANVTLTTVCAGASFTPNTGVTGAFPLGVFTSVFTGPATPPTVVCIIKADVVNGLDSGSASTTIVVGSDYAPLVPLPGIGSPTSFPAYLVGLYKLALMSIGIFAMLMILYGGFKYMTSAGNPALMGDAKDAIYSAIFGLILALLSWLILSTINPELVMVKTPGTTFAPFTAPASTASVTCSKQGALTEDVCECIDGLLMTNLTPRMKCDDLCAVNSREGTQTPPTCNCTDGSVRPNPIPKTCDALCPDNLNCITMSLKIGFEPNKYDLELTGLPFPPLGPYTNENYLTSALIVDSHLYGKITLIDPLKKTTQPYNIAYAIAAPPICSSSLGGSSGFVNDTSFMFSAKMDVIRAGPVLYCEMAAIITDSSVPPKIIDGPNIFFDTTAP